MSTQAVADTAGAIPPVTVGSFVLAGYPIEQWVLVLTALYTSIMIIKNIGPAYRVVSKGVLWLWRKVPQRRKPSQASTRRSRK